jgi:cyclopropane-fatty-acyl-phospholipid synthase
MAKKMPCIHPSIKDINTRITLKKTYKMKTKIIKKNFHLSKLDKLAKRLIYTKLANITVGQLVVYENQQKHQFGPDDSSLTAEIYLQDGKFFSEVAFGGSIGAAEAYILDYWSTNDLTMIIRILLKNRSVLDGFESGIAKLVKPVQKLLHWFNRNSHSGSRKNIAAHYDLGNDFFQIWLDKKMMYSCAVFEDSESTLEEASTMKLKRICEKLQLKESDHVVEIGSGWGGFAIYAAQNYGCKITTTTISQEQFEMAKKRIAQAGLSEKITLCLDDYRDLEGQYDKLVSIEMIEAVGHKYYRDFFKKCSALLKEDGLMVLQAITIADQHYKRTIKSVDFIQKYIFPGGCLPSVTNMADVITENTNLRMINIEDIGPHYATTLKCWRDRMYENIESINTMGYTDQFIRMWHYYLCYCEGAFIERVIGDVQITAIKPKNRDNIYLKF